MEKSKSRKSIMIIAAVIVLLLAITAFVVIFIKKKPDSYRLLKVFEVEGKANVKRDSIGDIEPYQNMVLESGDTVSLDAGKMTIKADDDKFLYLEEQTEIQLNATGSSDKGKINIELTKGGITNDIQNILPADSSYEINTPNSTMLVRGTIFRAYTYIVDGVKYTRITVFEGKVTTRLRYKDGTYSDKEVVVEKGKEVIIYEDDTTTDYLSDPTDIDYDTLPEDVLRRLQIFNDEGRDVSITNPEIKVILEGPYTVTFIYKGAVFGTQTVKKGELAQEPSLKPEAEGHWNFKFSEPIEHNTKIEWE